MTSDQVVAVVKEIRERVRSRHQKTVTGMADFKLPALDSLSQARDAAGEKVASIGSVNPRPPGLLNKVIQTWKKWIARLLNWFVRDQVEFNSSVLRYMDRNLEASIEQNYSLLRVAKVAAEQSRMEEKLTQTEMKFLRHIREMEKVSHERDVRQSEELRALQRSYVDELRRSTNEVQKQFWGDLKKLKAEHEHLIYTELRLIRQRTAAISSFADTIPLPLGSDSTTIRKQEGTKARRATFDYWRFEERFRGEEKYVSEAQNFYLPYFRECQRVVDLGCGRGEFLSLLREQGIQATGVDSDPDIVAMVRGKHLDVEHGDLFAFLSRQPSGSVDGIFCAHVVEHLPAHTLPSLIFLAKEKLSPGGILAIETPNPACLATLAGDFYLDPNHRRPVPSHQLHFFLQEAGLGDVEIHELHPAVEVFPEIANLDEIEELKAFRRKFFGGLDYAIIGRQLRT